MRIILHIGLHKTGTKYFQNYVFPELDLIYNPPKLVQYAIDFLRADAVDKKEVFYKFIGEKEKIKKKCGNRVVLLSKEYFSGNLFIGIKI